MLRRHCLAAIATLVPFVRATAQPKALVLATATRGGGFQAYGAALVAAIREADPAIAIEEQPTGGSAENVGLLRDGKVDLALVQGELAYPALAARDAGGLTVVAPMYPTPGLLAVTAASPIRSLADLRGRPVVLGTKDSGLTVMGRLVLAAAGIDPDRDIQPILLDRAADGPAMVLDGRAAALWGGGVGWPGFVTLSQSPGGARFIGPDPQAIERVLAQQPAMRRLVVPAGTYQGQDAAIETVGSWSLVLARLGLEAGPIHQLVGAIDRARPALAQRFVQGRDSDPRKLVDAVPAAWLHPGTRRWLQEIGAAPR
jgi:TRAP transporter TAXI family solute receptor